MPLNVYHTIYFAFIICFVTLIQTQDVAFQYSGIVFINALSFAVDSLF
jgi:hypothetical protein